MPKRAKATLYDLVERIIYMYHKEKKQIREIESILKAEGYDISKSSIHRALKGYNDVAKELLEIKEEVKALMESVKENPATDTLEIIVSLVSTRLVKFIKDIEGFEFDDPNELIQSIYKLSTAAEKLQRYRYAVSEQRNEIMPMLLYEPQKSKLKKELWNAKNYY